MRHHLTFCQVSQGLVAKIVRMRRYIFHRLPKLTMSEVIIIVLIFMQTFSAWWSDVFTADIYYLPWSWRFSLISLLSWFFYEGESCEKAAKLRERKTSSYFELESHLYADNRIRIWPLSSDWLIFYPYQYDWSWGDGGDICYCTSCISFCLHRWKEFVYKILQFSVFI